MNVSWVGGCPLAALLRLSSAFLCIRGGLAPGVLYISSSITASSSSLASLSQVFHLWASQSGSVAGDQTLICGSVHPPHFAEQQAKVCDLPSCALCLGWLNNCCLETWCNWKPAPIQGGQGETKERGRPLKGTHTGGLWVDFCPTYQNPKSLYGGLNWVQSCTQPRWSHRHITISRLYPWGSFWGQERQADVHPKDRGGGGEPLIARSQLLDQPGVSLLHDLLQQALPILVQLSRPCISPAFIL